MIKGILSGVDSNIFQHIQPLFFLTPSFFFPLTFVHRILMNFLYFCSLRLESEKFWINSGLTHWINTFVVAMTDDQMGCVAHAKMVFHRICNDIEFIQKQFKLRLTKVLCNIISCVLLLHFFILINHMPLYFYCILLMSS